MPNADNTAKIGWIGCHVVRFEDQRLKIAVQALLSKRWGSGAPIIYFVFCFSSGRAEIESVMIRHNDSGPVGRHPVLADCVGIADLVSC